MFSGIVEGLGEIQSIEESGTNKVFKIKSPFQEKLSIDQSIAHNGVCLTVEDFRDDIYQVTAIQETLQKSNLGELKEGNCVNLERSLTLGSYVDGHLVQGHVDGIGKCQKIEEADGSWFIRFSFPSDFSGLLVEKGSIAINGVSLTVFDVSVSGFSVAIIPYTFQNSNFNQLSKGSLVNLEFDLVGKYIQKQWQAYKESKNY